MSLRKRCKNRFIKVQEKGIKRNTVVTNKDSVVNSVYNE